MKTIFVSALMAVFMVCGAAAQNNADQPCDGRPCERMMNMTPEQMAEKRTERLSRELTLTDAQAKQVYQLNLKDAQNAVQHTTAVTAVTTASARGRPNQYKLW